MTKRLVRLADDDRFNRNRAVIAQQSCGDLQRLGAQIDEVTDRVEDEIVDRQMDDVVAAWQPSLPMISAVVAKCVEYATRINIADVEQPTAAEHVAAIRDHLGEINDLIHQWGVQ